MDWQYWNWFQAFINTVNFMCFELLRIEIIYILVRITPEQYPVRLFVFYIEIFGFLSFVIFGIICVLFFANSS